MSTRRKFLLDCSAITAAALVAPVEVIAQTVAPGRRCKSPGELSYSAFAEQLNTPFRIWASPTRTVTVQLAEVSLARSKLSRPGRRPPPDAAHEKFSLIFSGSRRDLLEQDSYEFEHETLGRFTFFIVPIFTRNPEKMDYEAVINRPRPGFRSGIRGAQGAAGVIEARAGTAEQTYLEPKD